MENWFYRVWTRQDVTAIDELFIPDGTATGLGGNVLIGPDGFKQFHSALCGLLTDFAITIDKSIESGDWLSVVCTLRARSRQSGAQVVAGGHVMVRIVEGKITEAYNHWDFLGIFSQLGLLPQNSFEMALSGQNVV
jgi:hypothetical protein